MTSSGKLLVYDGDCPFCRAASRTVLRWLRRPDDDRRPLSAFGPPVHDALVRAGANRALAVLDSGSGEIRTGISGLLWLAEGTKVALIAALLRLPPLPHVLSIVYRFIARNRGVLFRPRIRDRRPSCDCRS